MQLDAELVLIDAAADVTIEVCIWSRLSRAAPNPMTTAGDLAVGGSGSITGRTSVATLARGS